MPNAVYFRPEFFDFLRRLKKNNKREWFIRNKALYQQHVQEPALLFITEFSTELAKLSPHFVADARPTRGSLFRIYRDTRFSHDKRPYKTHVGIHFHHSAGKDAHAPVFYLNLEPGACFAAAGIWHPDTVALTKVRTAIVKDPKRWAAVRNKIELEGDSLSRPPRGFDPKHPFIDDLKRKDFISSVALTDQQACDGKFLREFAGACRGMSPLVEFTTKALGLKY
jgi:uncharacterized protein (TIGR02453 family)